MFTDQLTEIVAMLAVLSVASERLVDIVKGYLFPGLNIPAMDEAQEARRQAKVQTLAVIAGLVTAGLAHPYLSSLQNWSIPATLALGFLASGGSGLWNAVLGYLKGLKDLKQAQASETRAAARMAAMAPPPPQPPAQ